MPSSHSTRRENARRSFAPRFSLRCKTIARSLIFAPRRRLPPLFQGNFRSKPTVSPWVSCILPSSHSTRRENAGRSFAPRSCGTIAHSLIFAPRRRLPPPLLSARQLSLKTHGITVGFLHLCLPLTLRVAKILLRVPWGMLLPPPSLRAFLPRELTPPKILSAGTPDFYPTKNPADFTRGPRFY